MPDKPDYVTGAEFERWMREEAEFRRTLETRMAETARILGAGLTKIDTHLSVLNGSTLVNTHGIAALEKRLIRIEQEYDEVRGFTADIEKNGCAQFTAHTRALEALSVTGWTPKKKALVGSGMVATGALIWPAVQEAATAIHALVEWISKR